jgi:prepilin-type N-terminal cleavage/methylation domain-containing protein
MLISSFLTSFRQKLTMAKRGFTLIEILIVISIISVLSTIMLGYSRSSSQQILLTKLVTQTEALISNARFNSIQTFFNDPDSVICAHGVVFNKEEKEARVFQLIKSGGPCSENPDDYYYSSNSFEQPPWLLDGTLNQLDFNSDQIATTLGGDLSEIVFIPPDPIIIINGSAQGPSKALEINVGEMSGKVTVTNYGQVDIQYY